MTLCSVALLVSLPLPAASAGDSPVEVARLQFVGGELEKAAETLEIFLQSSPADPRLGEALYLLGHVRTARADLEEAKSSFRQLIEEYPKNPWAVPAARDLAQILEQEENWERAVEIRAKQANLYVESMESSVDVPALKKIVDRLLEDARKARGGNANERDVGIELAKRFQGTPLDLALALRLGKHHPAAGGNLVRNPGFEFDRMPVGIPPLGWEFRGSEPNPFDDADGVLSSKIMKGFGKSHTGEFAAGKYTEYGTHLGWFCQAIPVTPGRRYACTVYGLTPAPDGTPGKLRLGVDPRGGIDPEREGVVWTESASPAQDYQQIALTGESAITAASAEITLFLELRQDIEQPANSMLFDDASVVEIP